MKKILFIHHAVGWGGAPIAMINLIKTLDPAKYNVKVLLIKDSIVSQKLEEHGIKFSVASSLFFKKFYFGFIHSEVGYYKWYQIYYLLKSLLFWLLTRFYFAKKELSRHDFDIVHLNSSIMTDWLAPARAKGEVLIHIREPFHKGKFDLLYHLFLSQMRKYASKIVAISKDNANRIGLPEKTEVVYDYSELSSSIPKEESYYSKSVLYLGGASTIKGFYEIVESLKYLDKDVKVYFGGSYKIYKTQNKIKHSIKQLFLSDRNNIKVEKAIQIMRTSKSVVEIGLIFDVPKYLNEVCCLVSPFAKPHFSLPVLEAFACRKPVIVTDIEGAEEVVKHKVNGLIVANNNPEELAKAINYICNNSKFAQEMGENGFKDAQEKYSIINMKKIAEIYDRL